MFPTPTKETTASLTGTLHVRINCKFSFHARLCEDQRLPSGTWSFSLRSNVHNKRSAKGLIRKSEAGPFLPQVATCSLSQWIPTSFCSVIPKKLTNPSTTLAETFCECKACVPPNDFPTDNKIGRLFRTKKIGRFFHRFFCFCFCEFLC